jgi:predicted rRNA methylase YqxC with S4 and FtsJ domains
MAVLKDAKTAGAGFSNDPVLVRVVYDFAKDTGAVADYDVMTADSECIVKLNHMLVKTAVTSGGSLVMDLGKSAGGTEFFSDKAVAALTLNSVHSTSAPAAVRLAAGDKIVMGIEAAAATAGKVEIVLEVLKA